MAIVDDHSNEVIRKAAIVIGPTTYALRTQAFHYDDIDITYTVNNDINTVTYLLGGQAVRTLTFAYTGENITGITVT